MFKCIWIQENKIFIFVLLYLFLYSVLTSSYQLRQVFHFQHSKYFKYELKKIAYNGCRIITLLPCVNSNELALIQNWNYQNTLRIASHSK